MNILMDGPVEFSIYQPMTSASGEAAKHRYILALGKDGKKWVYADAPNAADQVWVDGGPRSEGSGGRTLTFELSDGGTVDLQGPWKTGADGLLKATGIDIRDRYTTRGIVALERDKGNVYAPDTYRQIIHYDEAPVIGTFDRVRDVAQAAANTLGVRVQVGVISQGGGYGGWADPEQAK
jgi:hypothetical protein